MPALITRATHAPREWQKPVASNMNIPAIRPHLFGIENATQAEAQR